MAANLPPPAHFTHAGRRTAYRSYGSGTRVVVLTPGVLKDHPLATPPVGGRRGAKKRYGPGAGGAPAGLFGPGFEPGRGAGRAGCLCA